ncbi:hypothetical protein GGQ71_004573 [Rhizobium taibaishanense]|uniref:Uncharacterized protein n=1 Tax=Allorhizobium taibaishanense TaxID=887144 RepID=A0A7W6MWB3_9HYPH|nr:hypothetical protein [Allorhizobium taibaishanense]
MSSKLLLASPKINFNSSTNIEVSRAHIDWTCIHLTFNPKLTIEWEADVSEN